MRSKLRFFYITIAYLLTGCTYDYSAGLDYEPQVVINSIINPDSTIKANLFWTKEVGSKEDYKRIEDFSAKIYEMKISGNDSIVFEGVNLKDSIITTYKPKAGKGYRIEVNVPEYGVVSAETSIPLAPTVDMKYNIDSSSWTHSYHFEINKISSNSEVSSIMVRVFGIYKNREPMMSHYIYANNSFCDQFNMYLDQFYGFGSYFEYFMRIPYKNLELAIPIKLFVEDYFTIRSEGAATGTDDWGFPVYGNNITYKPNYIALEVIAPSEDYDKYYKSTYQQSIMGDTGIPIFNLVIPIHSNVENGLGIFAGYSYFSFKEDIEEDEE